MKHLHIMSKVFNRIKIFRMAKGISQQALADRVGANRQTIGFLERQEYNPSIALALKIASVFDVDVHKVFSLDPFPALENLLST